jgi:hypothetical protein
MKKLGFLSILFLLGCNSNPIGVTRVDNQSSAPSSQQPGSASSNLDGSLSGDVTSSNAQPDPTIYFEEIRYRDGLAPVVNGLGFLDRNSSVEQPFVLRLGQEAAVTESPAFTPVSGGALVVDTSASGESTVRFTNVATLERTDLLSSAGITSIAATPSRDAIGWVDAKGSAFISKNGRSHQLHLGPSGLQAKRIVAVNAKSEFYVLVQGRASKGLLFNSQSQDAELSFDAEQLAISPQGDQVLVVNGSSVQVYDRTTKATKTLGVGTAMNEPSWQSENFISYWTENSGQPEIDLLNIQTNQQTQVSILDPSMASAGMICPVWNNGDLYFADFRDGKNLVLRAGNSTGSWNVTVFAESNDSRFGLICPSVSNYF